MPLPRSDTWEVRTVYHSAAEMHAKDFVAERSIWNVMIADAALVLGSAQKAAVVDAEACARAKVAVVHRRSGGGAVYLEAAQHLWVDVIVPRGDTLWDDDVVVSSQWLGDVWCRVLGSLGYFNAEVHRLPLKPGTWSKLVCFAGVGPGEVLINGVKAVGISQRRSREFARFQCIIHRQWAPEIFLPLLFPPRPSEFEIRDLVAVVDHDPSRLFEAFVVELNKI